ncbi:MFS transporter [Massilia terrae]|uniref:MFS transporter n=1 Tax=Massilia terrae TaxID=1811224 RepID=A0ABT2CV02_9BURK|nr:MFS transporter [Massilia terrae]MCS0657808.1 MFS transporter [Massilia terrae]
MAALQTNGSVLTRLLWARGLRAFADGYVSLLLPVYLIGLGMSAFEVGIITTGTLLGSGALSLLVGLHAGRLRFRSWLLLACALMAATGIAFALASDFWPLLVIAVVGTLNPSSGDVSVFLPLEHALLADTVEDNRRTGFFARYNVVGSIVAALGALMAGLPQVLSALLHVDGLTALRCMFLLYAVLGMACALVYRGLPALRKTEEGRGKAPLRKSKRTAYTLAALFSLDAFGGGFVVQSMFALWLFDRFQLSPMATGTIFFWTGLVSAVSYLAAAWISGRFGLVNTMVFTHLPSSLLLILIPFAPTLPWALLLLIARSALSQMDVPTRSSYVMAITPPEERAAAASVTSVPRSLAAAASPALAGYMLTLSTFGWPLIAAGACKIVYDLLLYFRFRHIRPPEEQARSPRNHLIPGR